MSFNSPLFILFFLVFFVLYHSVRRQKQYRLGWLVIASLIFYASWGIQFVLLLVAAALANFAFALVIDQNQDPARRKLWLTIGVIANLSVLTLFKYTEFFAAALRSGLHSLGIEVAPVTLGWAAPLGISFYTFQSVGHLVDVHRRAFKPQGRLSEFLVSLTFFPHLLSGPILRTPTLLPQLEVAADVPWSTARRALLLICAGLAKKTVADLLAPVANGVFASGSSLDMLTTWTGVLAFAAQIYADFSGYTDMAIGLAALVGIELPANFALPYLASGPGDFWRRWHISLSSWFRDYCFLPMVLRNRRTYLDLFLTMTLCGLWHGAAWTFVVYGMYHGAAVALDALVSKKFPGVAEWPVALKRAATFYWVVVGFIFFRADSLTTAGRVLNDMHHPSVPTRLTYSAMMTALWVIAALVGCHLLDAQLLKKPSAIERGWVMWPVAAALGVGTLVLGTASTPFIYFQF